ncbi:MAG: hypothetical protein PHY43_05210 [Verrucomicrobiales bacterium]|nr:hypothetical protein [Verrucomicrobiales bacterium]
MIEPNNPNQIVSGLGLAGLLLAGLWRLAVWVRTAPVTPNPWSAEIEASLQADDATPICHRCLTPHSELAWFCEHCGSAVGTYNNWMPYIYVFSQGEVLRNGVTDKLCVIPFTIAAIYYFPWPIILFLRQSTGFSFSRI